MEELQDLLPPRARRAKYTSRRPQNPQAALGGILFVFRLNLARNKLPAVLGFGCGNACRKRLVEWHAAGVRLPLGMTVKFTGEVEARRNLAGNFALEALGILLLAAMSPGTEPPRNLALVLVNVPFALVAARWRCSSAAGSSGWARQWDS